MLSNKQIKQFKDDGFIEKISKKYPNSRQNGAKMEPKTKLLMIKIGKKSVLKASIKKSEKKLRKH